MAGESEFLELRRKIKEAEVLNAALAKLAESAKFSGRISVVLQNGRVLKAGYEEGYFAQRERETAR